MYFGAVQPRLTFSKRAVSEVKRTLRSGRQGSPGAQQGRQLASGRTQTGSRDIIRVAKYE